MKIMPSKEDLQSADANLLSEPSALGKASKRRRSRPSSWKEAWVQTTTASASALAAKNNRYAMLRVCEVILYLVPPTCGMVFLALFLWRANPFFRTQIQIQQYCTSTVYSTAVRTVV